MSILISVESKEIGIIADALRDYQVAAERYLADPDKRGTIGRTMAKQKIMFVKPLIVKWEKLGDDAG